MGTIQTARGELDTSQLGATLMHEHIFILSPEILINYPQEWGDDEARIDEAVTRLQELKQAGVDSIVDLTVIGLGRDVSRIKKVAERTELQIVVGAGLYTYNQLPWFFRLSRVDRLTDYFVRDIVEGIADTGVKAGILKCATDEEGLTPDVEAVVRAVAQAHRQTGVPISTHTHVETRRGLDQQRIFKEEGVDLSRVVIGHSGDSTDISYLEELVDNGSWLGMDRFGLDTVLGFEERVNTVATMCERGHAGRMVLSHDTSCHMDWVEPQALAEMAPRWNFLHITHDVLPALRKRGVTDEQIEQMLVANPRAVFEQNGSY